MLPVIWDGVSDPLMGWIVTRTRSRFGKFRPYILFGAPLMGFSFVGMFAAPIWFPDHVVIACLATHMIFRTAYTVASVPYSSLAAALTHNSQERGTIASAMDCADGRRHCTETRACSNWRSIWRRCDWQSE